MVQWKSFFSSLDHDPPLRNLHHPNHSHHWGLSPTFHSYPFSWMSYIFPSQLPLASSCSTSWNKKSFGALIRWFLPALPQWPSINLSQKHMTALQTHSSEISKKNPRLSTLKVSCSHCFSPIHAACFTCLFLPTKIHKKSARWNRRVSSSCQVFFFADLAAETIPSVFWGRFPKENRWYLEIFLKKCKTLHCNHPFLSVFLKNSRPKSMAKRLQICYTLRHASHRAAHTTFLERWGDSETNQWLHNLETTQNLPIMMVQCIAGSISNIGFLPFGVIFQWTMIMGGFGLPTSKCCKTTAVEWEAWLQPDTKSSVSVVSSRIWCTLFLRKLVGSRFLDMSKHRSFNLKSWLSHGKCPCKANL